MCDDPSSSRLVNHAREELGLVHAIPASEGHVVEVVTPPASRNVRAFVRREGNAHSLLRITGTNGPPGCKTARRDLRIEHGCPIDQRRPCTLVSTPPRLSHDAALLAEHLEEPQNMPVPVLRDPSEETAYQGPGGCGRWFLTLPGNRPGAPNQSHTPPRLWRPYFAPRSSW